MFWFLKFAASGHEYLNSLIKKKIRVLKFWLAGSHRSQQNPAAARDRFM